MSLNILLYSSALVEANSTKWEITGNKNFNEITENLATNRTVDCNESSPWHNCVLWTQLSETTKAKQINPNSFSTYEPFTEMQLSTAASQTVIVTFLYVHEVCDNNLHEIYYHITILMPNFKPPDNQLRVQQKYTVNQKNAPKCFLLYLLQSPTDSDKIWYVQWVNLSYRSVNFFQLTLICLYTTLGNLAFMFCKWMAVRTVNQKTS